MNIDGHEVERRGNRLIVELEDDYLDLRDDPNWIARAGAGYRAALAYLEVERREAAEKAAQDAADELDRRADRARMAWIGRCNEHVPPWNRISEGYRDTWRNVAQAVLDADAAERGGVMRVYIEPRDWWIGYYRGDTHHYVCILPTVVIRWARKGVQA